MSKDIQMKSMMARCITPIIMAIDWRERKIRVTRSTLNVRKTRTVRKACKLPAPPSPPYEVIIISTMERITTPPSSRFILSAEYFFGPRASSFMHISTIKIQVKISFMRSRSSCRSYSMSYDSMAIPIVLTRTLRVISVLNRFERVNTLSKLLAFFT